jgi:hypothetical protein
LASGVVKVLSDVVEAAPQVPGLQSVEALATPLDGLELATDICSGGSANPYAVLSFMAANAPPSAGTDGFGVFQAIQK